MRQGLRGPLCRPWLWRTASHAVDNPRSQYFLCWIALAGITFMYSMILPTIITARATVPQLGIFAFVVHPAMFGALTFMFRFLVQKVKIRELRSVNLITGALVPLHD